MNCFCLNFDLQNLIGARKLKSFEINVNDKNHKIEADPSTPLLWILRDNLNLVGTKYGCGISQCGACTVHLNGEAIRTDEEIDNAMSGNICRCGTYTRIRKAIKTA